MPRSQAVSSVTRCLSQPACPCNPGPIKEGIYSCSEIIWWRNAAVPGQHHRRYTVQEVLKKLKCLLADESDGEKDSDGLDSGSEADFDDTYSDDSVDDNHSSDSSCTANFSNESSVEADDSSEEEYRPTPKRRCAVPSSTPSSGATSQARSPSSDDSHEYESEECEEAVGDDTPPLQTGGSGEYVGKDGSVWSRSAPRTGRANAANVLHQAPGLPLSARRAKPRLDAFLLLIDPTIIRRTVQHTIAEAQRVHGSAFNLGLDEDEFLAILGLVLARVLCARNEPLDALWSKDYGRDIFRNTMTRTRFKQITRFIRFDDKTSRTQRRQNDKFCLIREVWDRFVVNCRQSHHPTALLTVDEQLFATKCRCPFTQYMPSKPGKFGIKFWVLADAEKPYVLNMKPYLGKQFDEDRGALQLGEFVVLDLMQPYLGKGYNVTTDNFFTSFRLSQKLLQKKTTIVGTVRANRRELPKEFTLRSRKLHDTKQGFHLEGNA